MLVQNDVIRTERQWGYFLQFTKNESTTIKLLHIEKGLSTSLQYHHNRSEKWYVISGKVFATKGIHSRILEVGDIMVIDKIQRHKLEALEDSIVLEISRGLFDENDIVRL